MPPETASFKLFSATGKIGGEVCPLDYIVDPDLSQTNCTVGGGGTTIQMEEYRTRPTAASPYSNPGLTPPSPKPNGWMPAPAIIACPMITDYEVYLFRTYPVSFVMGPNPFPVINGRSVTCTAVSPPQPCNESGECTVWNATVALRTRCKLTITNKIPVTVQK